VAESHSTYLPLARFRSPKPLSSWVTALLATHRLQDGFALANFRFDPKTKAVIRDHTSESRNTVVTRFLVLRDGRIYFEGFPEELLATKDPYLQRFLI